MPHFWWPSRWMVPRPATSWVINRLSDILQIEAVRWTLTAIFALLIWSAADYFLYRRQRAQK